MGTHNRTAAADAPAPLTGQQISAILTGKRAPSLEQLCHVAESLDVPTWMLMLPGLANAREMRSPDAVRALEQLIENYMASDHCGRFAIERMASAMREYAAGGQEARQ